MIRLIIFSLIILSIFFFFTGVPYFYISMLSVTILFLIILFKIMWSISVNATDKMHQFFDEKDTEN